METSFSCGQCVGVPPPPSDLRRSESGEGDGFGSLLAAPRDGMIKNLPLAREA